MVFHFELSEFNQYELIRIENTKMLIACAY